ncbi:hypothetical protein SEVIR_2G128050v4 [Setaria viridis]
MHASSTDLDDELVARGTVTRRGRALLESDVAGETSVPFPIIGRAGWPPERRRNRAPPEGTGIFRLFASMPRCANSFGKTYARVLHSYCRLRLAQFFLGYYKAYDTRHARKGMVSTIDVPTHER